MTTTVLIRVQFDAGLNSWSVTRFDDNDLGHPERYQKLALAKTRTLELADGNTRVETYFRDERLRSTKFGRDILS